MHHEIIVNHHACALFEKAISVRDAATIRDVSSPYVEPLSSVVSQMQSDSDPHKARTEGYFSFCAVK